MQAWLWLIARRVKDIHMTDIYFRTDGNSEIATGHLVRCLAIARACAKKGAAVKFIVSDQESLALLEERFCSSREFEVFCLNRCYREISSETSALLSCLSADMHTEHSKSAQNGSCRKPWLFIDSYYAGITYFEALRPYFRTAYLDDLRNLDCAVDLVINYDTARDCPAYANAARKLLGIQYTPLREQFCTPSYEVRQKAGHVLFSTGGTDPYRVAESLLRIIYDDLPDKSCTPLQSAVHDWSALYDIQDKSTLQAMQYHLLTSRANTRYAALAALAQAHPQIQIHTNVSNVAALMAVCDLAVSAGGTTLCELCAVGVPSVSYLMAENQRIAVETYATLNLIPCAGDIRPASMQDLPSEADTLRHILDFLLHMAQNHPARAAASSAMRNLHDGAGADRIAAALLQG